MKSVSAKEAIRLATMIRPAFRSEEIREVDLGHYHDLMCKVVKTKDYLRMMEPTHEDLHLIRTMLAGEFSRPEHVGPPRLSVVMVLLDKHEKLFRQLRVQPLLDELPALAVAVEKATPKEKDAPPMVGAALQGAMTAAMHGPVLCPAEGDEPCRHGCASGQCNERGKKAIVYMTGMSLMRRVCPKTDKTCDCSLTGPCDRAKPGCLKCSESVCDECDGRG